MKRYIFGMSKAQKDLESWIEDRTFPTMEALAQLYLFPDYSAKNHWRQEVWNKFSRMHVLRTTNKLPSAKFIYESSWGIDGGFVQDAINSAIGHEYQLTPRDDIDVDELTTIMEAYFIWLSENLSQHITLNPKDVYEKLEELGL